MSLTARLSSRMRVIQRCARTSTSCSLRVRTLEAPRGCRTFLANSQLSLRPAFSTNLSSPMRHFSEKAASSEGDESNPQEASSSEEKSATEGKEEPQDGESISETNEDLIKQLKTQLEEAEKQAKEFKTAALEYKAEVFNVRNRGQKETANAKKFAIEKFAKDILVVADNIDLALKNVKAPQDDADKDLKTLYEALQMTQKTCIQVFERFNVKKAEAKGLKFDTAIHEVLFQAPMAGKESGEIFEVVRDGYWIGDRVLRSAQVGVAQ